MRVRIPLCVAAIALFCVVGISPASASPVQSPPSTNTPYVLSLLPVSSTNVHPGDTITLQEDFGNVLPHPSVALNYQSRGVDYTLPVDIFAGAITIPADIPTGTYVLQNIVISNIDGSVGTHYRNNLYVGTAPSEPTISTHYVLHLEPLDLHVV